MPQLELYEKKTLRDEELPVQIKEDLRESPGLVFRRHWHEHLELHYILEGSGRIFLNQDCCRGEPGVLIIANSNELHSIVCDQGPYRSRVIIFDIEDLSRELARNNFIFQSHIEDDGIIGDLMGRISREWEGKLPGYKQVCRALVLELLVHLCRNYVAQALPERDSLKRKKDLERLNSVLCHIEDHYSEPISNASLARIACLSEDRFGHLFREGVGKAPLQYINELRLKKALGLLKTNEYTVTEVAEAVGFRDYNHFGRLFRRTYGCTPLDVKRGKVDPMDLKNDSGIV